MEEEHKAFEINKGLQMPLIFMIFKGKFIFYAFGALGLSVIIAVIAGALGMSTTLASFFWVGVLLILLGGVVMLQNKGLNSKKVETGLFYIRPSYKTNYEKKK